jgi:hypothetical protein
MITENTRWPTLRANDSYGYGFYFGLNESDLADPEFDIDYLRVSRAIQLADGGHADEELIRAIDDPEAVMSDSELECRTHEYQEAEAAVIRLYLKAMPRPAKRGDR